MKQVLTIAGSDPGGGAGIQADLKSIHANGAYGLSVITAVTAQNTLAVTGVFALPEEIIRTQLDAVFDDFEVAAVKTGMLVSAAIVECVADELRRRGACNLVVDPVMIATSGRTLLPPEALESLRRKLLPLATLVTPNIPEAECLTGMKIRSPAEAEDAARRILRLGPRAVLVKGGHLAEAPGTDVLCDGGIAWRFAGEFIDTPNTHGTGCTYAAAIAAQLARGRALPEAIGAAKAYLIETIRHSLTIGHGPGPLNHFPSWSVGGAGC
jgi:hydroxymethylpyrimidine/phosphomethylpyrimidine kinase